MDKNLGYHERFMSSNYEFRFEYKTISMVGDLLELNYKTNTYRFKIVLIRY